MITTLMEGLNEKNMQAVVRTYNLNNFYYPTLMPLKENYSLTFKALSAQVGLNIAGDIVARGASIDKKTRIALDKIYGDIPKIAISRDKDENELSQYYDMLKLAEGDSRQIELVKAWAEDTEYCFKGVASRLEWLCLKGISTGRIQLTDTNNVGVVSEFDFEYDVTKKGVNTPWSTSASATPIDDLKAIVKEYRQKHINLKYAWMNVDTFDNFCSSEQVIKQCAGYLANLSGISTTPSLEEVNKMLSKMSGLFGLQIRVIDQEVTIELADGSQTTANPFATHSVLLTEGETLGETFWKKPVDLEVNASGAILTMNRHTLIKKWGQQLPTPMELTQGIANAIPVWEGASRSVLVDTHASSWSITD